MDHTLAGGLILQSHLHRFKQVLIRTSYELLVCSDPDLGILLGGAIQLQQHSSLKEGNCCQQLMLNRHSPLPLRWILVSQERIASMIWRPLVKEWAHIHRAGVTPEGMDGSKPQLQRRRRTEHEVVQKRNEDWSGETEVSH